MRGPRQPSIVLDQFVPLEWATHPRTADAVEKHNFQYHDNREKAVQVEDYKGSEPSLTEEIADCGKLVKEGDLRMSHTWGFRNWKNHGGVGIPSLNHAHILYRPRNSCLLWWDRVDSITVLLTGNEPVDGRVHEREHNRESIEQRKVELFSKTGKISRKRHCADYKGLNSSIDVIAMRVVEMSEGPTLLVRVSVKEPESQGPSNLQM